MDIYELQTSIYERKNYVYTAHILILVVGCCRQAPVLSPFRGEGWGD